MGMTLSGHVGRLSRTNPSWGQEARVTALAKSCGSSRSRIVLGLAPAKGGRENVHVGHRLCQLGSGQVSGQGHG
jgi:hypothetical protein